MPLRGMNMPRGMSIPFRGMFGPFRGMMGMNRASMPPTRGMMAPIKNPYFQMRGLMTPSRGLSGMSRGNNTMRHVTSSHHLESTIKMQEEKAASNNTRMTQNCRNSLNNVTSFDKSDIGSNVKPIVSSQVNSTQFLETSPQCPKINASTGIPAAITSPVTIPSSVLGSKPPLLPTPPIPIWTPSGVFLAYVIFVSVKGLKAVSISLHVLNNARDVYVILVKV